MKGRLFLSRLRGLSFVLLAFVVLALAVSLINPLHESTDEIRHYRYIRHLVVNHRLPVQGAEAVRSQSHHPPLYYLVSAIASAWVPSPHTAQYEQPINPFWGYRLWEVGVDNKLQYLHSPAEPFREGHLAALIPRWVNVLFGAATVWLTYRLGRRVWPDRPPLAWGAAVLVGLTPQFIYLSAAINNDIAAATMSTAVLLLSVDLAQRGPNRRCLILLGLAYGLALLTKFHLLALGGVIALAMLLGVRTQERRWAKWFGGMELVAGLALLVAGWWFVRNWLLYGDPTGLNKVNELWAGRPANGNWWALWQGLPYLWTSLWGRFGYGQIPLPAAVYDGLLALCGLALAGYLLPRRGRLPGAALLILGAAIVGFVAVVCYYILIQPAGPMGRFLFPVLPAFAVVVVGGLERWLRRPAWAAGGVAVGMAAVAALAIFGCLMPAVSYPPRARELPAGPAVAQFGDVARVLAVGMSTASLHPGDPLFVTVVWEPLRQTATPYIVYVHLIDEAGVLVAQRDTWPGLGRAPTTAWRPGRPFVDVYRVDLPEAVYAPSSLTVRVGLYEPTMGRLSTGTDDGITVGTAALAAREGAWPNPLQANFGGEVTLVGYTLEPRSLAAGETFTLTLYWQTVRQPTLPYMVFSQVIDTEWRVWGSSDGAGPLWSTANVAQDVRHITLLPETPPGSYPVQVGLFYPGVGRLPLLAPDGHYLDERILLGPIRVRE